MERGIRGRAVQRKVESHPGIGQFGRCIGSGIDRYVMLMPTCSAYNRRQTSIKFAAHAASSTIVSAACTLSVVLSVVFITAKHPAILP
jgi:hypothetical protein